MTNHKPTTPPITISNGYISLNWEYPYEIALSRIPDQQALLRWVLHLSEKTWMDGHRINVFIQAVAHQNGWQVHGLS